MLPRSPSNIRARHDAGLTLFEVLLTLGMVAGITAVIALLGYNLFNVGVIFQQSLKSEQEADAMLQGLAPEMRSMTSSATGSYPLSIAATSTVSFYSDINHDGAVEQVRYFLDGNVLKKGVIIPSGNPLRYNQANETFQEVVHSLIATTTPLFSYYDATYTGAELPLAQPVAIQNVRVIQFNFTIRDTTQSPSVSATFNAQYTPRNLRSL